MPTSRVSAGSQRALDLWPHLISQARLRETIYYDELSEKIYHHPAPLALNSSLNKLCAYCKGKNLPLLSILAVSKETGEPGAGLDVYPDVPGETERVFAYDWLCVPGPSLAELASC